MQTRYEYEWGTRACRAGVRGEGVARRRPGQRPPALHGGPPTWPYAPSSLPPTPQGGHMPPPTYATGWPYAGNMAFRRYFTNNNVT